MPETRQQQLEEWVCKLVDNAELGDQQVEEFAVSLCKIYSDSTFRHSYAGLSKILGEFDPEQRDALCYDYMERIRGKVQYLVCEEQVYNEPYRIVEKVDKLCDHIKLEGIRMQRIARVEHIGDVAAESLAESDGKFQETLRNVEKLNQKVSGFHAQSITILGIFAALVVAFTGTVQIMSGGLANLSEISAYKICLFIAVVSFFMFNITFLLLYCVSKISGNSISVHCRGRLCDDCKRCRTGIQRLQKKYPYMLWFNVVALLLCAACFLIA